MAKQRVRAAWVAIGGTVHSSFVLVALVAVLPFIVLLAYFTEGEVRRRKDGIQQEALTHARALATPMEAHLAARVGALIAAADAVGASGAAPAVADAQLRRLRQAYADLEGVTVADRFGTVVAAEGEGTDSRRRVVSDQEWFQRVATSQRLYVGEPRRGRADVVVGLYAAARGADGRVLAVVAADLGLGEVRAIADRAQLGRSIAVELLTEKAAVSMTAAALRPVSVAWNYAEIVRRHGEVSEFVLEDGKRRLVANVAIRPLGWVLVVGMPSGEIVIETRRLVTQVTTGAVLAVILAVALGVVAGRRATAGVERLRTAVARLETGRIPANVPVTTGGEIGALTEGFNQALGWLRAKLNDYEAVSQVEEVAGAAITGDRELSAVLPGLLRKVVGGMGADAGILLMRDEQGLVVRASTGFWGITVDGTRIRGHVGIAAVAMDAGRPVVVSDLVTDERALQEPYLASAGLASLIAVPIIAGDRVIGAVEIGYRTARTVGDAQLTRLAAMTRRAAQALGHARAIEEIHEEALQAYAGRLEQEVADRTRELQAKTEALEERSRELQERTDELQEAMRLLETSQQRVVEGERLRALGEMASGIAHDFNNALAVILGRTQLLLRKAEDATLRRHLEVIEKMAIDSGQTVRRIREFTRMQPARPLQAVDLNRLVDEVMEVTKSRWRDQAMAKGIRFDVAVEAEPLPPIAGEPSELREALMNLVFNAIDAMPQGGRLTFRTRLEGDRACVVVADTGIGMAEDVRRRVFEPFFTTKGERGTGLGLSIVYGIVSRHGGKVDVRSQLGEGSAFSLRLPVGGGAVVAPTPVAAPAPRPSQKRKILVIDDEEEVRETLVELLADQGHAVAACPDGRSGLARFDEELFDLVLTDLGMPGLSGWDVARLVKERRPRLPVALVTGWGDQIDVGEARAKGVDFVVAKPFEATDITAVVTKAFARGVAAA